MCNELAQWWNEDVFWQLQAPRVVTVVPLRRNLIIRMVIRVISTYQCAVKLQVKLKTLAKSSLVK